MMKLKNRAIILLSGGLDSVVSIATIKEEMDVSLAITFNYGQKSFENELAASKKIAKFYSIDHEIVTLDWLNNISTSALNTDENIPRLKIENLKNIEETKNSAKSVWVPNRNALFINIAACYAESRNFSHIIIGANKEEAQTFKDNSLEFINAMNNSLKTSTNTTPQVIAPLINLDKTEIVQQGVKLNIPFEHIYSCYLNGTKQCGECESCLRLKRALELNNRHDIIANIFK